MSDINNTKVPSKRLDWIDSVKGIGILLVVISHLPLSTDSGLELVHIITSFYMPLFFIISGILMYNNRKWENMDFKTFFKYKLKTLMYPYLTFSAFMIILLTFETFIFKLDIIGIGEAIVYSLTLTGYGALWYLPNLFASEVLFFIVHKYILKQHKSLLKYVLLFASILIPSLVVMFIYPLTSDTPLINLVIRLSIRFVARAILTYAFIEIGYIFFEKTKKLEIIKNKLIALLIACVVFVISCSIARLSPSPNIAPMLIPNPVFLFLFGTLSSLSVVTICFCLFQKKNPLNFFGKNSLTIMATHIQPPLDFAIFIVSIFKKLLSYLNISITLNVELLFAFFVLIAIECVLILIINKFMPFILKFPNSSKSKKQEQLLKN